MNSIKINHLAILVCVVLMFALGFLWYGPLFGAQWIQMVDIDMEAAQANPPGAGLWVTNLVSCVAPLYALAWLFAETDYKANDCSLDARSCVKFCKQPGKGIKRGNAGYQICDP